MVGPEERGKSQRFGGLGDAKLVGVTGALLRFNEYPKVHERQSMPDCPDIGSVLPTVGPGVILGAASRRHCRRRLEW